MASCCFSDVPHLERIRRLKFEQMLTTLSASFVNINSSEVDYSIERGLEMMVGFLGIDRAAIVEFTEDLIMLNWTHSAGITIEKRTCDFTISDKHRWFTRRLKEGVVINIPHINALPDEATQEKRFWALAGIKSNLTIPLTIGESRIGGVTLSSFQKEYYWSDDLIQRIKFIGEVFANALTRKRSEMKLKMAVVEIRKLKEKLEQENACLKKRIEIKPDKKRIIGKSNAIKKVLGLIAQVAATNATVLIQGETGTGKELIAQAIHDSSKRSRREMVAVNCAALPSSLLEAELFGREKGSYTGALSRKIGRFEIANGTTIFLDEIGELPLKLQAKILRVLQEGKFERLGSTTTLYTDVRVIAATNRELIEEVASNRFREDLYYRLNIFPIFAPPLRDRQTDIPLLVWAFVQEFLESMGKRIEHIPSQMMEDLKHYAWPGNVRELRNVIERAMILSSGLALRVEMPKTMSNHQEQSRSLEDIESRHITHVLQTTHWRIRGKNGAAAILGLIPTTLDSRIKKLGIQKNMR